MATHSNIEAILANAIKTYFESGEVVAAETLAECPPVTFFDPMSLDEAHRCVIQVPSAQSSSEFGAGNFEAEVEIVVKSRWAQPTMTADWEAHNARVKAYRDAMLSDTITRGQGITGDEIDVYYVGSEVGCNTSVRGAREGGWFVTSTTVRIQVGLKVEI